MIESIDNLDRSLFLFFNRDLSNGVFDILFPFIRNQYVWIPLYVLMIGFFLWRYRWYGLAWVVCCFSSVGMADVLSSHVLKKTIMRPRPCHIENELIDMVLRVHCGTGYSFTSSHAANHMALAAFVIATTAVCWKTWRWSFLPWALLIGLAQIYVGVHYPIDVVCGFLLGGIIGSLGGYFFHRSKCRIKIISGV